MLKSTDALDHLANIIAHQETKLLAEVVKLQEVVGVQVIEAVPEREERQEKLVSLAEAMISGDPEGYYVDELLSETIDNAERAKQYLDMDEDAWASQIETWADQYRDQADGDPSDRTLAHYHVEGVWGIGLDEFEARVVDWSAGEMLKQQIAGNFSAVKLTIRRCREKIADADLEGCE
jgi:hypothetical protein